MYIKNYAFFEHTVISNEQMFFIYSHKAFKSQFAVKLRENIYRSLYLC